MKFLKTLSIVGLALAAPLSHAQTWPARTVTWIVPFAAGGPTDAMARDIAEKVGKQIGQTVIIENAAGAGGTIGATKAARAQPDGYTFLVGHMGYMGAGPSLYKKLNYDPVKSFTHIAHIGSVPNVFVVHPSVPARTMPELVKWISAQTTPVNYGSGGVGSIGHIVGEMFKNQYKLKMEHVPYKGSSPMHTDLLGGQLQFAVDTLTQNVPYMKEGKLIGIAVTSRARAPMSPGVPSVVEAGYPKLLAENFLGISAPAGTPKDVVDKVNAAVADVVSRPDVAKRLADLGVAVEKMTSAEFTKFVSDQVTEWAPEVKASGARLN